MVLISLTDCTIVTLPGWESIELLPRKAGMCGISIHFHPLG